LITPWVVVKVVLPEVTPDLVRACTLRVSRRVRPRSSLISTLLREERSNNKEIEII